MSKEMQPKYDALPVYHPTWKAMVAIGTFGILDDGCTPVQIIESVNDSNNVKHPPTVRVKVFTLAGIYLPTQHRKVVEYGNYLVIEITRIESLAWVFAEEHLSNMAYELGDGVSNVFLWETDVAFPPFPDEAPDYPLDQASLSFTTFHDLQRICDAADKILNREAMSQGEWARGRSQSHHIAKTTINFIKRAMGSPVPYQVPLRSYRKRTKSGMETHSFSETKLWEMYRFETDEELNNLLSIFGPTIILGNRTKRPKIDEPYTPQKGRFFNVVKSEGKTKSTKFQRNTTSQGIDLAFDGTDFRLSIRYQRSPANDMLNNKFSTDAVRCCYLRELIMGTDDGPVGMMNKSSNIPDYLR